MATTSFVSFLGALMSVAVSFWLGRYFAVQQVPKCTTNSLSTLPRIDPVKVGHVREIQLFSGQVHEMRTLSVRPALFEIANFLSDEECREIIRMAEKQGMVDSLVRELQPEPLKVIERDVNKDGKIDKSELRLTLQRLFSMIIPDTVVNSIMVDLVLDADRNEELSYDEFNSLLKEDKMSKITSYIDSLKTETHLRSRVSNVTWLEHKDHQDMKWLFDGIKRKIQKVTGLPRDIIWTSEPLQVLRYDKNGHYHCHYDSENWRPNQTCCQYDIKGEDVNCTLCRYITLFYYLNEPEEGGETAFPIADDNAEHLTKQSSHLCDLSLYCKNANIFYKPKRGTAILWYNHYINETTGWLGRLDRRSIHGGCDVIRGVKWSANNWINVGRTRYEDEEFWIQYMDTVEDYTLDYS